MTGHALHSVRDLLFGGDWACAENQVGTLQDVACELAERALDVDRDQLHVVAELCEIDMEQASALWESATRGLRCGARGRRHDDPPLN